ncbi:UNVERIFIED_CONTAM: hypothetical protein FKN15_073569 [Acipenser sinensis]
MAVNLAELSLPQLEGLKGQFEQETEFLTSSIAQLKVVQSKFVEAKDCMNVLKTENKVCAHTPSRESCLGFLWLLNGLLSSFFLQNVEDTKEFFKRKIDFLTKQIEKIQPALQEKHGMKQAGFPVRNDEGVRAEEREEAPTQHLNTASVTVRQRGPPALCSQQSPGLLFQPSSH